MKVLEELKNYGETIPYELFPNEDGILPFGITDNGDVLFWQTSKEQDNWKIIVNEVRSPDWEAFEMSMTKFLLEILSRRLVCKFFPAIFPGTSLVFDASS